MHETMKAWVYESYGVPADVMEQRELALPQISESQVLIEVRAASVNPLDWHLMTGLPRFARFSMGLSRPKRRVPGADVAGIVERVGAAVTRFKPGDEVFGEISGSFAEYASGGEGALVAKPENVTFEQAAAVPVAGLTALQGLRDWGGLEAGRRVLINGASGGVGTYAVQIAKLLGAHVTGVCSTRNIEKALALGADQVVDYTREDFTRLDEDFDVIFDGPGNRSLSALRRVMAPGAVHVQVGGPKGNWIQPIPFMVKMRLMARFLDFTAAGGIANSNEEDLTQLSRWLASGELESVIGRNCKLEELPDALMDQGRFHAQGKVVVSL